MMRELEGEEKMKEVKRYTKNNVPLLVRLAKEEVVLGFDGCAVPPICIVKS